MNRNSQLWIEIDNYDLKLTIKIKNKIKIKIDNYDLKLTVNN